VRTTSRTLRYDDGATTTTEAWGESGPTILAVHGIGSSRKDFRRLGEALAGRARLVAYDQRGHGDAAAYGGPMTVERLQADLRAVFATIAEPVRLLLGHSWGGATALLGGRRLPVERVLAIDPLIRQDARTWEADYVDDVREPLAVPPDRREPVLRALFAGAAELDLLAKVHALGRMTIDPIVALGTENAPGWDLAPELAAYPKPLLVLLADPAESIVGESERAALRATGGANVRIACYAGAPHALHRTEFARVLTDLVDFAGL